MSRHGRLLDEYLTEKELQHYLAFDSDIENLQNMRKELEKQIQQIQNRIETFKTEQANLVFTAEMRKKAGWKKEASP